MDKPGETNGRFLGLVANGVPTEELRRRWKAREFPGLSERIARQALKERGV